MIEVEQINEQQLWVNVAKDFNVNERIKGDFVSVKNIGEQKIKVTFNDKHFCELRPNQFITLCKIEGKWMAMTAMGVDKSGPES